MGRIFGPTGVVGTRERGSWENSRRIGGLVERILEQINRHLASYETIKKFAILDHDFSIEAGELTSSLKLRRKEVTAKHLALLESFYTDHY